MLRQKRSPARSQRRVVRRDQLLHWRSWFSWVVCLQIPIREDLFHGKAGKSGSNHAVKFSKSTWHGIKIRARKGPARGITQQREPHERNPFRASWCQGNAGAHFEVTRRKKNSWFILELQCTCWAKRDLSSDETETLRRSRNLYRGCDGKRWSGNKPGCTKCMFTILVLFVTVQVTRGYACSSIDWKTLRRTRIFMEWVSGQERPLTKKRRKFMCKTDNFVPLVVPGVSSSTGTSSSSTSSLQDPSSTTDTERSDEHAPGNWGPKIQKKKKKTKQKEEWQSRFGRPLCGGSSWMVGGVHK